MQQSGVVQPRTGPRGIVRFQPQAPIEGWLPPYIHSVSVKRGRTGVGLTAVLYMLCHTLRHQHAQAQSPTPADTFFNSKKIYSNTIHTARSSVHRGLTEVSQRQVSGTSSVPTVVVAYRVITMRHPHGSNGGGTGGGNGVSILG